MNGKKNLKSNKLRIFLGQRQIKICLFKIIATNKSVLSVFARKCFGVVLTQIAFRQKNTKLETRNRKLIGKGTVEWTLNRTCSEDIEFDIDNKFDTTQFRDIMPTHALNNVKKYSTGKVSI
jgi:hypothetical protein